MVGRRLISPLFPLLIGTVLWANGAVAGPNLPPAPYTTPPEGTVLDYGDWKCTVQDVDGFKHACVDNRRRARFFAGFLPYGQPDEQGYAGTLQSIYCYSDINGSMLFSGLPLSLPEDAQRLARSMWPLKVGNKTKFVLRGPKGEKRFWIEFSVHGVEKFVWNGEQRDVFRVTADAVYGCSGLSQQIFSRLPDDAEMELTWWYDPERGVVLKHRRNWTAAALTEEYTLQRVIYPTTGAVAQVTRPQAVLSPRATPYAPITTEPRVRAERASSAGIDLGRYHALVIGNNRYRDLPGLKTAAGDAQAVAAVLREDYGFGVDLLVDATRSDIFKALARLRARLTFDDNLLIYYGGHGFLDEVAQLGYWLPVDAERDVQTNWISNGDVTAMLRAIRARHVMVVADSCFTGTLVRSAGVRLATQEARTAWIERMARKRSRTALVSGGLEPVADSGGGTGRRHSVFARAFLTALRDNTGVMDGNALFNAIKRPVVLDADQTPQYSDIRRSGHEGGDFLFVKRK